MDVLENEIAVMRPSKQGKHDVCVRQIPNTESYHVS